MVEEDVMGDERIGMVVCRSTPSDSEDLPSSKAAPCPPSYLSPTLLEDQC